MTEKILTGSDIAKMNGYPTFREFIFGVAMKNNTKILMETTNKMPIKAKISFGRWLSQCECGGHEMVDPDDRIFFCQSCGNSAVDGKLRKVKFPENLDEIEKTVLERVVDDSSHKNMQPFMRAVIAKPVDGVPRSWEPGESVADLKRQHKQGKKRMKEAGNGNI
jgi:hypothetical protein